MSFTYDFNNNPNVAYVRLLIPDTTQNAALYLPIFQDEEINAFYTIQASVFMSPQFWSPPSGSFQLPSSPLSYLRVAALAIDSLASNAAQLAVITKLLDVNVSAKDGAAALQARADKYRQIDDESGAFAIIEQVSTTWAFTDRYWKQVQRQSGGGGPL